MADLMLFGEWFSEQEGKSLLAAAGTHSFPIDAFYLEFFWAKFPWIKCPHPGGGCLWDTKCHLGCLPRYKKIQLLRAMASLNLMKKPKAIQRVKTRKHFENYVRDEQDDRPCFACGKRFDHRHHIIQIQHGGRNRKRNLVLLCRGCHSEVHAT